jgi:hypothetical protein
MFYNFKSIGSLPDCDSWNANVTSLQIYEACAYCHLSQLNSTKVGSLIAAQFSEGR